MKNQFSLLRSAPRLRWLDLAVILVSAVIWYAVLHSRDELISLKCQETPEKCAPSEVIALDRVAIGLADGNADRFSYVTQNVSGYLALGVPPLMNAGLAALGRISPMTALVQTGVDFVLILETTLVNGALMESTRVLTQRPRPYVYAHPASGGGDAGNYVSFYSGHTSFAAAANVGLWIILLSRGAPLWLLTLFAVSGQALTFMTGLFRVLAGRHFVTDVLVAMVVGTAVAWLIALAHRSPTRSQPHS